MLFRIISNMLMTYHCTQKVSFKKINTTIEALSKINHQIVWLWPNVDAGSDIISKKLREVRNSNKINVRFYRNFKPDDYIHLLMKSKILIGNSSSGIRECSALGIPSINIGNRQVNRERGSNVIDTDYDENQILKSIEKQITLNSYKKSNLYGDGQASNIIAETLINHPLSIKKQFYEI